MTHEDLESARRVRRDLALPAGDQFTQDWIYELPDELRTADTVARCLAVYANPDYGDGERRVLMKLMMDVTNDLMEEDSTIGEAAWIDVARLVRQNSALHCEQLRYWVLDEEPLEDAFALTSRARGLWDELFGANYETGRRS